MPHSQASYSSGGSSSFSIGMAAKTMSLEKYLVLALESSRVKVIKYEPEEK